MIWATECPTISYPFSVWLIENKLIFGWMYSMTRHSQLIYSVHCVFFIIIWYEFLLFDSCEKTEFQNKKI